MSFSIEKLCEKFNNLKFNKEEEESIFQLFVKNLYKELQYLSNLSTPSEEYLKKKQIKLPEKDLRKKKTLFLDLDETLVHTSRVEGDKINFKVRPFLKDFLNKMCKIYEIYAFTAGSQNYAEMVVNFIDPEAIYIDGIISRKKCLITKQNVIVKDLKIIKNRNIKDMILVDNLAHSFGSCINNGIPIISWYGNIEDKELLYLSEILIKAVEFEDCREFIEMYFQLKKIQAENLF